MATYKISTEPDGRHELQEKLFELSQVGVIANRFKGRLLLTYDVEGELLNDAEGKPRIEELRKALTALVYVVLKASVTKDDGEEIDISLKGIA